MKNKKIIEERMKEIALCLKKWILRVRKGRSGFKKAHIEIESIIKQIINQVLFQQKEELKQVIKEERKRITASIKRLSEYDKYNRTLRYKTKVIQRKTLAKILEAIRKL